MKTYQIPNTQMVIIASSMVTMLTASVTGPINGVIEGVTNTPPAV